MNLPAIERPNGKLYRPRAIRSVTLGNEDELTGIVIFGTHDAESAARTADLDIQAYNREWGADADQRYAVEGEGCRVWWAQKLSHFEEFNYAQYVFRDDEEHGRAGVRFDVVMLDPEECPACDTPLVRCATPEDACCADCRHGANRPSDQPLIECPHWAQGRITLRARCFACEAGDGRSAS